MGQAAHAHDNHGHGSGGDHHIHSPWYYVKIWAILLGLLVISILGPMMGHKVLTIITAFGIAIVKALLVASFFMHLNIEKKYVWYILFSMLLMVVLFYWGVATDINRMQGRNWIKTTAAQLVEEHKLHPGHGGREGDWKNAEGEHGGEAEHGAESHGEH